MDLFKNICLKSTNENDIASWLNNIKTSSEEINKAIKLVKKELEDPNCKKRDEAEKRLNQLIETASLYKEYLKILSNKKKIETSKSYENLEKLFNAVSLNIDNLWLLNSEIKRFMNDVKNKVNLILTQVKKIKPKKENNKIEIKEKKSISELFKKYYWDKPVYSRWSINSISFLKKLYFAIDRNEIDFKKKREILEYWYIKAFKHEIKFWKWKEWIENIRRYELTSKKIFLKTFKNVLSPSKAEKLFLLQWVEWNWLIKDENSFWAIWMYQILLSTSKMIKPWTTKSDLKDPKISTEIASEYLKRLIISEKKKNPNASENQLISKAITRYNWGFTSRLKDTINISTDEKMYNIFRWLNFVNYKIKNNKYKDKDEIIRELKLIRNKYYSKKWLNKFKSHFWILDKKNPNKKSISKWIDNYIKTILKQQDMYAIQFNAINKVYNKKNS